MYDVSAAPGEPGGMPLVIAERLQQIGVRIEPAQTADIYAPLHAGDSTGGVNVLRDLRYGPHERNVLDIFAEASLQPATAGAVTGRRPVLVFLHGGGFVRGAKTLPGLPFYDNVMRWAARNGFVGVNINYRLAPDYVWPSGIEDLTALAGWLQASISDHGGDAERILFWGHSAGAAHVADYIAAQTTHDLATGLAGAVLTSGFYRLGDEVSAWQAYYGTDVSTYAERSSLRGLAAAALPLLVNDAELDPETFREQAALLVAERVAAGRPTEYIHLLGHSHISETYAVGTDDRTLADAVLSFAHWVTSGAR